MKMTKTTVCAMLAGLTVVLQLLSGLLTGVLPFSLSLVLIPISVAAYFYGVAASTIVGAAFGVTVLLQCIFGLDAGGVLLFQENAFFCTLLTVGRGALVGLVAGLCVRGTKPNKFVFAALSPIINTGIFIIGFIVAYTNTLIAWAGGTGEVIAYVFLTLTGINFLIEEALNLLIFPPVAAALEKVKK